MWLIPVRCLIASGLGFLVGSNRAKLDKPCDSRDFALVSLGATFFTLIALEALTVLHGPQGAMAVNAFLRVVSNIVVGMGFLGGGIIYRSKNTAEGVTTAAGLWVMAAVGTAIGLGLYLESVSVAFLIWLVFRLQLNVQRSKA